MALDKMAIEDIAAPPTAPLRKRRRRAPASGATEDCFTCRKRNTSCDRRRPYCTQCINLGGDCSGYRTQLTWGVGVASRGKLRGKSLPILNPPKTVATPHNHQRKHSGASNTSAGLSTSTRSASTTKEEAEIKQELGFPATATSSCHNTLATRCSPPQCSPATTMSAISMAPSSNSNFHFVTPNFHDSLDGYYGLSAKRARTSYRPRSLHRLQTHQVGMFDNSPLSAPASIGSMRFFGESDFGSRIDYPHTAEEGAFSNPFANTPPEPYPGNFHSARSGSGQLFVKTPRLYPTEQGDDLSSSFGSDFNGADAYFTPATPENYLPQDRSSSHVVHEGFDYAFGSLPQPVRDRRTSAVTSETQQDGPADVQHRSSTCATNSATAGTTAMTSATTSILSKSLDMLPFRSLSLRAQFLLDYYDRMMCPVLVAFDGPGNPYRMHILQLAVGNEGLQHAIAALAMNNMRMRQMSGLYGTKPSQSVQETESSRTPASFEEQQYRATAIAHLNSQLGDASQTNNDSVLATLLILCLFNVCDSGFSKFKTQLAGVQKLLRMRNESRDRSGESSDSFLGWVELFFTWVDVMNSTVNDRETEVKGDSLNMIGMSADRGTLEHLTGCEGGLFKIIARLGRLNLLSQQRPVREESASPPTNLTTPRKRSMPDDYDVITPRLTPALSTNANANKNAKVTFDLSRFDFSNLDGNGWGSLIHPSTPPHTPGAVPPVTSALRTTITTPSESEVPDSRHSFWEEWHSIRSRLDAWRLPDLDGLTVDSAPQSHGPYQAAKRANGHADLAHISHAFHACALLYTERLASPLLPPSAPSIQAHVGAALSHIGLVRLDSCFNKFLLWPLFIAGTECVEWRHRAVVRDRIVGLSRESGFFNNMAGLGVLERLWEDDDGISVELVTGMDFIGKGLGEEEGIGRQAFRWRKLMLETSGEYLVI